MLTTMVVIMMDMRKMKIMRRVMMDDGPEKVDSWAPDYWTWGPICQELLDAD